MDTTYKFSVDKVQNIREKDRALVRADPKFIRRIKVSPSALMKVGTRHTDNIKTANSTNRTLQYITVHFCNLLLLFCTRYVVPSLCLISYLILLLKYIIH